MVNQQQIDNRNKLNDLSGITRLSDEEILVIQAYYNDGKSLRKCQTKFGHCRATLIKYLTTRSRTKLHEQQKNKEM